MYRSALFCLAALVLFGGIYAEEASQTVIQEESSKSVGTEDNKRSAVPANLVEKLNPDPEDFLHRGKNYTFFCDEKLDFFEAWRKCMDKHLELATIETLSDNLAFEVALGSYSEQVYTSGTDMGKEGSWVWLVNHRPIPSAWGNVEAWETGEPNNQNNEDCLAGIIKGGRVQWNDVPCDLKYCYMCQDFLT